MAKQSDLDLRPPRPGRRPGLSPSQTVYQASISHSQAVRHSDRVSLRVSHGQCYTATVPLGANTAQFEPISRLSELLFDLVCGRPCQTRRQSGPVSLVVTTVSLCQRH